MIDDFRIGKQLGEGYSAIVYQACRVSDNHQFALKVFQIQGTKGQCREQVQLMLDEVEVMTQL